MPAQQLVYKSVTVFARYSVGITTSFTRNKFIHTHLLDNRVQMNNNYGGEEQKSKWMHTGLKQQPTHLAVSWLMPTSLVKEFIFGGMRLGEAQVPR